MDNIVEFKLGRSRSRHGAGASGEDAQILFFTGVRYFREAAEEPRFAIQADFRSGPEIPVGTASQALVERATH